MSTPDQIVPGRTCGTCMMCCKLPVVPSMNKPLGKWCVQAAPGRGCKIYADRPTECRQFNCGWLLDASLGPEWKPEICKFLMYVAADGALTIMVDPAAPGAWRDPRFYPAIKTSAARLLERNMPVMVLVGARKYIILPERDVEVTIPPGHAAQVVRTEGPQGVTHDIVITADPAA